MRTLEAAGRVRPLLVTAGAVYFTAAGLAFGHGTPDQVNDPSTSSGVYCSSGSMFQSFTPSRRLLTAVDLRLGIGPEFPADGVTSRVQVRQDSINGAVLGGSTYVVTGPREPFSQVLAHFDFGTAVALDPAGEYFIEWLAPPGLEAFWAWSDPGLGSVYPGGNAWPCAFGVPTSSPTTDFNFITSSPADAASPDTRITRGPPSSRPQRGNVASFEFTGSDDLSYADHLHFECGLDMAPLAPCGGTSSTAKTTRDGTHTFRVRAIDESGSADATPATATWIVDNTAPSVRIAQRKANDSSLSFAIAAEDNVDSPRQLRLLASIDSGQFAPCSSVVRVAKSRHARRVRVVALDRAGNRSRVAVLAVRQP
jgi:hypothetical protein